MRLMVTQFRGQVAGDLHWVHHHDFLHRRLRENGLDLAQLMLRGDEEDPGAGIANGISGLLGGQCGVHRHRHRSEQQNGHIGSRPFGAILAENRDAIAFANSPVVQGASRAGDVAAEILGRDGQPLARLTVQHHAVEIAFNDGEENIVQRGQGHGASVGSAKPVWEKFTGLWSLSAMPGIWPQGAACVGSGGVTCGRETIW